MTCWIKHTSVALSALAVAVVGCSSSDSPAPQQAFVRVAHFAPEIPAVDICVDGQAAIQDLAYGEASARTPLTPGTYNLAIALVGGCETSTPSASLKQNGGGGNGGNGGNGGSTGGNGGNGGSAGGGMGGSDGPGIVLDLGEVELDAGEDVTAVAYRAGATATAPVDVFVFDNTTTGLMVGSGRVVVGHGADDDALDPVDVVIPPVPAPAASAKQGGGGNGGNGGSAGAGGMGGNGGGGCTVVIDDFVFGTQTEPGDIDLPGGEAVTLAFNLKSQDTCPPFVPEDGIAVPVTADVVSILVAVDEDTTAGVDPELWALIGTDGEPVRLIKPTPAPAN